MQGAGQQAAGGAATPVNANNPPRLPHLARARLLGLLLAVHDRLDRTLAELFKHRPHRHRPASLQALRGGDYGGER
jgi:hypothetical protein